MQVQHGLFEIFERENGRHSRRNSPDQVGAESGIESTPALLGKDGGAGLPSTPIGELRGSGGPSNSAAMGQGVSIDRMGNGNVGSGMGRCRKSGG